MNFRTTKFQNFEDDLELISFRVNNFSGALWCSISFFHTIFDLLRSNFGRNCLMLSEIRQWPELKIKKFFHLWSFFVNFLCKIKWFSLECGELIETDYAKTGWRAFHRSSANLNIMGIWKMPHRDNWRTIYFVLLKLKRQSNQAQI